MLNTVRLLKGFARLTKNEMEKFEKGNTIWGNDSSPEELKRWSIEEKAAAVKELEEYRCTYEKGAELTHIKEYALEYFRADEDGEFVEGSDFDLAKE